MSTVYRQVSLFLPARRKAGKKQAGALFYGIGRRDICSRVLENELLPICRRVAEEKGVPVNDIHAAFAGKPELFVDGCHPNAKAARTLADICCFHMRKHVKK